MEKNIKSNETVETVDYGKTVIPRNRLDFLSKRCREILKKRPGNVVEIGVYKGGTLIALAEAVRDICPENKVYGIDTFKGHPYTDSHPVHPKGKYDDVEKKELEKLLKEKGLDKWVELHEGKVEDIFEDLNLSNISFAHIDCDLYIAVKYCSENITPKINEGGMIYFDDYGHEHCPGATKAVDEIFSKEKINEVKMDDGTCWSCYIQL